MNTHYFRRLAGATAALAMVAAGLPSSARAGTFPPLNHPMSGEAHPGKFVWADLFTTDPLAAAHFYSKLFGWSVVVLHQNGRDYTVFSNGNRPVAGMVTRSSSSRRRLSRWIPYLAVSDIATSAVGVAKSGGIVRGPVRDFPDRGLQAIVSDPEGSVVGLIQSSSGDSADGEPVPGDWNWLELYAKNPRTASAFYGQILGYDVAPDTRTERKNDFDLSSGGRARAGVAPLPDREDAEPGWLGVVRVADVSAAVAEAAVLGGEIDLAPRPAAYHSRFAVITDPTGGTVGLVQYLDDANPANRP